MKRKVCFVAPPFSGHLNPLIDLAHYLVAQGLDVHFTTGAAQADLLRRLGFAVDTVLRHDPYAMERIVNTAGPVAGSPARMLRQLRGNLALLPGIRQELRAIFAAQRPDVVVADFCAPVAGMVCDELDRPWITTIPTPFALETRRGTPSYLGGWGRPRHWGQRLRDAAGRGAIRAGKRVFSWLLARQFRALGTAVYRPDGSERAYSPHAILGLGMAELEFDRDWPAGFRLIGPLTASPETAFPPLAFAEQRAPRAVLVTLGTHLPWAKRGLLAQLAPFFRTFPDVHFVVSLGEAGSASAQPRTVGPNWSVYGYVPYDACLARFAAVVHHGGAGIVYSCIRAARPSLICPQDYDQFDYAQRVHERGAGLRVASLASPQALAALRTLLTDFDPGPLRRLAEALRHYYPHQSCLETIERLSAPTPLVPPERPAAPGGACGAGRVPQRGPAPPG